MHIPVLPNEVLTILNPKPGQRYIDATINGGGHARMIAEKLGPEGKLLGIDWDKNIIAMLKERNQKEGSAAMTLVCGNFADIKDIAESRGFAHVDGVLFDLGISSYHLENSGRGFSFLRDEPLDMRFHPGEDGVKAGDIINGWAPKDLEDIFREYGEERRARRIAKAIAAERKKHPLSSSLALARLIEKTVSSPTSSRKRRRMHPATRVFQALRMAVNHELENLKRGLEGALALLKPGGIMAVITFHSLEERAVKNFFRKKTEEKIMNILTKKPLLPSPEEIARNPRARSAHLRSARRLKTPTLLANPG
jgi:16S rRNA (cytosine1402-N4)-methyltransferase